jgi:DNA-directed RNA polymerase subunit L
MSKNLPFELLHKYRPILDNINLDSFIESREAYYYKLEDIYYTEEIPNQIEELKHPSTLVYTKIQNNKYNNNDTLLIVSGESWTYGDSLTPLVRCVDGLDFLPFRLSHTFSSHIANWLRSDLLQYSEPGNANFDIWYNIDKLIEFAKSKKQYKRIFIISQLTTPGRDFNFSNDRKLFEIDRFSELLGSPTKRKLNYLEWAKEYDEYYLDWGREISKRGDVDGLLIWKNFNQFHSKNFDELLVIEEPFMSTGISFSGYDVKLPVNNKPEFFDYCKNIPILNVTVEELIEDMSKLERSYELLGKSRLNNYHPNKIGHWVLATLMRDKLKKVV